MKPNFRKLFEAAKQAGLEGLQLHYSSSSRFTFSLFKGEIDSYTASDSRSLTAVSTYQGKLTYYTTENFDKKNYGAIIDALKEGASYKTDTYPIGLFEGEERYRRNKKVDSDIASISVKEKIDAAKKLYEEALSLNPRVQDNATVYYREISTESYFMTDKGLCLPNKNSYCLYMMEVPMEENGVSKDGADYRIGTKFHELGLETLAKDAVKEAAAKFGASSIKSGQYPTVLRNDIVASLVGAFVDAASAESVEKKTSFLLGKLGEKIAPSFVTISELPFGKGLGAYYYDDEGVAAKNKDIIKRGVLNTYLHNRETASRAGVSSTGNASLAGGKFRIAYSNLFMKGRNKSFEEMISPIKKGVYITSIMGLSQGLNATSGDFSCQAEGFLIEEGKLTRPINLITMAGNLLNLISSIKDLDNRFNKEGDDAICPDVYIKKMSIGGE